MIITHLAWVLPGAYNKREPPHFYALSWLPVAWWDLCTLAYTTRAHFFALSPPHKVILYTNIRILRPYRYHHGWWYGYYTAFITHTHSEYHAMCVSERVWRGATATGHCGWGSVFAHAQMRSDDAIHRLLCATFRLQTHLPLFATDLIPR